jgi:predicted phage terminase large subunit-like protein
MKDAIERTKGATALLTKPDHDTIDWIGTRWALHDIYSWLQGAYGDSLGLLQLPVIDSDGKMLFPELISPETLALKRQIMGPYRFSCLMMNNPRNVEVQDLNTHDLCYWEWVNGNPDTDVVILYGRDGTEIDTWHIDQLDITTTVDLAPAETLNADRNAVVTVGVSPKGQAVVLDAWGSRCKAFDVVQKLFDLQRRYQPRLFGVENVAYQAAFKHFVEQKGLDEGVYLRVVPVKAPGGKKSHVRGIQPVMAVGRLFVHAQQHLLINEMNDYPLGEHDDVVDALALQLQVWTGVLSPASRKASAVALDEQIAKQLRTMRTNSHATGPANLALDPDDDIPWRPGRWSSTIVG